MKPTTAILLVSLAGLTCACGSRSWLEVSAPPEDAQPPADDVARCNPSNCGGCCDDAGVCQPGTATLACGEQGRACTACNPRFEICKADPANPDGQVCFSPCDFQGCSAGCCLTDGTCILGTADDQCGGSGTLCQNCTDLGQICGLTQQPRRCVAP